VSEFKAVLAAVYIAVELKQVVSSDMDKNKQKVLKLHIGKTICNYTHITSPVARSQKTCRPETISEVVITYTTIRRDD